MRNGRKSKTWTAVLTGAALGVLLPAAAYACPMHGGKIVDINPESGRVVVVKGDDLASFRANPEQAKITLNGKQAKLSDLKAGDIVNVNYDVNEKITEVEVTRKG